MSPAQGRRAFVFLPPCVQFPPLTSISIPLIASSGDQDEHDTLDFKGSLSGGLKVYRTPQTEMFSYRGVGHGVRTSCLVHGRRKEEWVWPLWMTISGSYQVYKDFFDPEIPILFILQHSHVGQMASVISSLLMLRMMRQGPPRV